MQLHIADFAALIGYFGLIVLIGVWTSKKVESMDDFIMPRRFGKLMMTFFGFGTGTHSDQAVSVASKTYTNGASGIWYQWLWLFVTPFYWLLAPMMRRFRALTTANVFELRYSRSVAVLFAIVGLMQYSVNIGVMLLGSSAVIEASTGGLVRAEWAIPIMTILFVAYGVAGGLHAAVLTDLIQGILTIVFSFLLLPFLFNAIGGFSALHEKLNPEQLSLVAPDSINTFYIVVLAINALVGIVAQPHFMANCAAGRTELDGQVGIVCGNLLKRICTIAWTLTGLAAIVYFTSIGEQEIHPDKVFGRIAYDFLPNVLPGLLGLFIAGLLASVMSSCDAFMITSSGLFAENIYKPLVPGKSEQHYLRIARISSIVVVASGVAFAYSLDSVIDGLEIFWKVASLLGIAFWIGLFWRGMTSAGAWASTIVAFTVMFLCGQEKAAELLAELSWNEQLRLTVLGKDGLTVFLPWQMVFYLTAGAIAGIVVSWFTTKTNTEKLDRFYALIRTPVTPDELHGGPPCTLPEGISPPQPNRLVHWKNFEILRPSAQTVIGFLASWIAVGFLIAIFVWLIK